MTIVNLLQVQHHINLTSNRLSDHGLWWSCSNVLSTSQLVWCGDRASTIWLRGTTRISPWFDGATVKHFDRSKATGKRQSCSENEPFSPTRWTEDCTKISSVSQLGPTISAAAAIQPRARSSSLPSEHSVSTCCTSNVRGCKFSKWA